MPRKTLSCLAILLAALTSRTGAQPRRIDGEGPLPEQPGAFRTRIDPHTPLERAARRLPEPPIALEPGRSFRRVAHATLAIENEPRHVTGRVVLLPTDARGGSRAESVVFFLHGQRRESVNIPPGDYEVRMAFRRVGRTRLQEYPRVGRLKIDAGRTARLTMSRETYTAIKHWLDAIDEQRASERGGAGERR